MTKQDTPQDDPVIQPDSADAQVLQDEIAAFVDGVEGTLVDNPGVDNDTTEVEAQPSQEPAEPASEPEVEPTPDTSAPSEGSEPSGTDGEASGVSENDEPEAPPATAPEVAEPTAELEDPGDFKPGDYAFEITTKDGEVHKITTLEEARKFAEGLDEAPENISASAFMDFNAKVARMTMGVEQDKVRYEAAKLLFDEQQAANEAQAKTISQIYTGLEYLVKKGAIPALDPKYDTAEMGKLWNTPEYKDKPGIKERLELLQAMAKENKLRSSAGLDPSFDMVAVHTAMELDRIKTNEAEVRDKQHETVTQRGSMVTGPSVHVESNERPGTIVGTGGSLEDLVIEASNY